MTAPVLDVYGLVKVYGAVRAVDGVSFAVDRGEILGLLGPNGAGKTTVLECIEGLRTQDAGTIRIGDARGLNGRRPRVMGVQLQTGALPAAMTVTDAMCFFCAYNGVAPRMDLLERFGLSDKATKRYGELSVGNQRRLALALAIAHRPVLVLLDEPTAGLDVASRTELHAVMRELADAGTAILLATHDMPEAEKMADRVAIVLGGRIVVEGTPREITAAGANVTKVSVSTSGGAFAGGAVTLPAAELTQAEEGYAVYFSQDPAVTVAALLREISELGDTLVDLRVERPSLEERFLEITHTGRAAAPLAGTAGGAR